MQYKQHDGTSVGDMSRVLEVLMRIGSGDSGKKKRRRHIGAMSKHEKEIAAKRRKIEDMRAHSTWSENGAQPNHAPSDSDRLKNEVGRLWASEAPILGS